MELFCVISFAELGWYCRSLDDLDARGPHTMTWSHFVIHLFYSTIQSGISVLLVHVMVTCPALVSHPDTIVLYCSRLLFKYLQAKLRGEGNKHYVGKRKAYWNGNATIHCTNDMFYKIQHQRTCDFPNKPNIVFDNSIDREHLVC
jgi:hypothetical protein